MTLCIISHEKCDWDSYTLLYQRSFKDVRDVKDRSRVLTAGLHGLVLAERVHVETDTRKVVLPPLLTCRTF